MNRNRWKIALGILLGLLLVLQLFQIPKTNPAAPPEQGLEAAMQPPADVMTALRAACYDCHSNETKYPWYTYVNPPGWIVGNHIREGREALNFSVFASYSAEDRAELLEESAEMLAEGEMPLQDYLWMHPEARLSSAQRSAVLSWLSPGYVPGQEGGENGSEGRGASNGEHEEHGEHDD
ncbi:MAG: heme-binding domain-containing protein [Bacteroidia bacterium]|nr:heme-binding domain-containing protein [Bacteroidia bacterium]